VGAKIAGGTEIPASPDAQTLPEARDLLDKNWSPTALELFFQCQRHFYLRYIAKIREQEEDDPFTVISAADEGTLVHEVMEQTANKTMSDTEFLDLASEAFDDFLVRRPPMHPEEADKKKRHFLDMMKNAFKTNSKNRVVSAEEDYRHRYPDDDGGFMWIKGKPDRVEETAERDEAGNVTYLVADYKTKRRTDHKPNDINTCLQVVLYSWLCKQEGMNVTKAEYRYLRLGKTVSCVIDPGILGELGKKLIEFKHAMETNEFPRDKGNDNENCRYCKFKDICDWDGEEVSEDDD
jgi:CRISPR/Cas system-associated exonuclease Cas4 (RecB family)